MQLCIVKSNMKNIAIQYIENEIIRKSEIKVYFRYITHFIKNFMMESYIIQL